MKNRRDFIKKMAAGAAGTALAGAAPFAVPQARSTVAPSDRVVVGIMGTNGRGMQLSRGFARLPGAEVAYICDVDERAIVKGLAAVKEVQDRVPAAVADFRHVLDDASVDALVISAPNHWHAPATILACQAGKHVYVEKPGSHNPREGELSIAAARRHNRVVQMGNQRRSWPGVMEGIRLVQEGAIGSVHYSRGWYANSRGSIGRGTTGPVPSWLDWDLWQGPAPRRTFQDNFVHYNWHWFWHWGTGEAGNNGMHALDLCRWGLEVDYPVRVTAGGGRYYFQDDQETPDTHVITLEFEGGKSMAWEGLSCNRYGIEGTGFGATFHGSDGTIKITGNGYERFDRAGEPVSSYAGEAAAQQIAVTGPGFDLDADHLANFCDCVRSGERPRSDVEEGYKSTLLTHLGNIALRTGRTLQCDPRNGHVLNDPDAMRLWSRTYEPGWEPVV